MKRKEKAHLKEDPLVAFVEKSIAAIKKNARKILIGTVSVLCLVVILLLILYLKSHSVSADNDLYLKALNIRDSKEFTFEQKVEKLKQLKGKKGLSSVTPLFLARLYFEKGEIQKAEEALKGFSESKLKLINDEKKLLEAEVLNTSGKKQEAVDLMYKLFSDPDSEIAQDYLLLRMAKIQLKIGHTKSAISNLKKITEEFNNSLYNYEARTLLDGLED